MGILSALIGVVFLVYLLLRISRMVGGTTTTVVSSEPHNSLPTLPDRSDTEIQSLLASMPTAWVVYEGTTPPLNLKVRGLTHELYRRFLKTVLDDYGREVLNNLSHPEVMQVVQSLLPTVNAQAYVVEWSGAQYPNGNPLPANVANLVSLMRKDEMLRNFISNEAEKLGPAWA